MNEIKLKIINGEIEIQRAATITVQARTPEFTGERKELPTSIPDEPTLKELSIIGMAFKKSHEIAMNKLIAKEQENSTKQIMTTDLDKVSAKTLLLLDKFNKFLRETDGFDKLDYINFINCIKNNMDKDIKDL